MSDARSQCIRCGDCLLACPSGLSPLRLFALWRDSKVSQMAAEESLDECIVCRRCDEVCPSELPLADSFAAARRRMEEMRRRKHASDLLRERHESHLRRLSAPRRFAQLNPAALAARAKERAAKKLAARR